MKKILLGLIVVILVGCGKRHEPAVSKADKVPVKFFGALSSSKLKLTDHEKYATTYTFFMMPELGTINWNSALFDKEDSQEDKLAAIMAEVVKSSRKIDDTDEEVFALKQQNTAIQAQMDAIGCEGDDDGGWDDDDDDDDWEDDDWGDDFKSISFDEEPAECEDMRNTQMENIMKMNGELSVKKSGHILEIQDAIDAAGKAKKNWYDYGTAADYMINLKDRVAHLATCETLKGKAAKTCIKSAPAFRIKFPTLGPNGIENRYDSLDGDIYDIKYEASEFAPDTMMLYFKMKEKDANGIVTDKIFDIELEKQDFAGNIRFTGKVYKYKPGQRRLRDSQWGIMKFELAPNEF